MNSSSIPHRLSLWVLLGGHNAWIVGLHYAALLTTTILAITFWHHALCYFFSGLFGFVVFDIVFMGFVIGVRESRVPPEVPYRAAEAESLSAEAVQARRAMHDYDRATQDWRGAGL